MEVIDKFRDYLIQEEKSELTIEKHIRDVQRFLIWLGGECIDQELRIDIQGRTGR